MQQCDEQLTSALNDDDKIEYLNTILTVIKSTSRQESVFSVNAAGGDVLQRFHFVLEQDEKKARRMGAALMCGISLAFCCHSASFSSPAQRLPPRIYMGRL